MPAPSRGAGARIVTPAALLMLLSLAPASVARRTSSDDAAIELSRSLPTEAGQRVASAGRRRRRRRRLPDSDYEEIHLDRCGEIVANASLRDSAWLFWVKNSCKCPKGQAINGESHVCVSFRGERYFPDWLPAKTCYCEHRRFMYDADNRQAEDYLRGSSWSNFWGIFEKIGEAMMDWSKAETLWEDMTRHAGFTGTLMGVYMQLAGTNYIFPNMNFVQGFKPESGLAAFFTAAHWSRWISEPKWRPPVAGEKLGVVTYQQYARTHFNKSFPMEFFDNYYTGNRVPSWEDNENHAKGVAMLDSGYAFSKNILGQEPMQGVRLMEPRFAFDPAGLMHASWRGFSWFGPYDIKYASNGIDGIGVVERLLTRFNTKDTLGVLMTDSVFSAHLTHRDSDKSFHLDLESLGKYSPIPGYARLGGGARFSFVGGRLKTEEIHFDGKSFKPSEDDQDPANRAFRQNRLEGWRYAEKAVIASLLSMTNLVLHVKDLHLELAAAFQATSVDAFAADPTNPVRRLLDPFIHRSVQATNDNFKLLFDYKAAEFSLAPLPYDEQLKLIDDAIREKPLNLADLDMERYGELHGMDPAFSQRAAHGQDQIWFWRWHYRAVTMQRLFDNMIGCWLDQNYGDGGLEADELAQGWWMSMIQHIPSLRRATSEFPDWAQPGALTKETLRRVLRTLFVWLAWIHEDVGHSAAAYVYNPVHTPMCVPEDGEGVPIHSFVFNALAYRGFVFLERAKLLDEPPSFWFGDKGDEKCFADFQNALRELGQTDPAFSECDDHGFYSCVGRVETAVSS